MKKIALISLVMLLSRVAMANISINLTLSGYVNNGTDFLTSDRLVQFIWCQTDPSSSSAVYGSAQYLASGEHLLWSSTTYTYGHSTSDMDSTMPPSGYDNSYAGGAAINSGYIFARVFGSSTVSASTKYYQSTAVAPTLLTYSALDPSSIINYNISSNPNTSANLSMVTVPEPSTVGLLLLGAGLVALRRMRRA